MRMTWFSHPEPLDTKAADELLALYAARHVQAKKILAFDPRFWTVSALLPESKYEPIPSKQYEQPIWSR